MKMSLKRTFYKCITRGGSPKECPQMPNMSRFCAIFVHSHILHLHALPFPSPLSSATSPLFHFTLPFPSPRR